MKYLFGGEHNEPDSKGFCHCPFLPDFPSVNWVVEHAGGFDHCPVRQPPVGSLGAARVELRVRRPSWFVLVLYTAGSEEVVDLALEDAQTPVPVFGFRPLTCELRSSSPRLRC